ncbi:MAG: type 1 glutamine amidotransferase domain-containing protein, partial [Planctomycetota bacterium]
MAIDACPVEVPLVTNTLAWRIVVDADLADDVDKRPAAVQRFLTDKSAMAKLASTPAVRDLKPRDFDAVFIPGGHGTMWDLPKNAPLNAMIGKIYDKGGVVGAVCHGPAALVNVKRADGKPLVAGHRMTGFTNDEENAVGLTKAVPFLLET